MKRNCNGCRAYDSSLRGCQLGYKTEYLIPPKGYEGLNIGSKPLENCPKPRTNKEFIDLSFKK